MLVYYVIYVEQVRKEGHMIDWGFPDKCKINDMNISAFIWSLLQFFLPIITSNIYCFLGCNKLFAFGTMCYLNLQIFWYLFMKLHGIIYQDTINCTELKLELQNFIKNLLYSKALPNGMSKKNCNWKWCPFIKHTINSKWNHLTDKKEWCHYLCKQVLYFLMFCW